MTAVLFLGAAPAVGAPAEILDVGGTPLGVVVGSDGTAYVGDYGATGGIRVIPPGAARPSRTHQYRQQCRRHRTGPGRHVVRGTAGQCLG